MKDKPDLLIIADDDLSYGIKKGYYPDLSKQIGLGNLCVYPLEDRTLLEKDCIQLAMSPKGDGKDFYVRNPYTNSYVSMLDPNILNTFGASKSHAVKEALVRMGAKDIVLEEEIHNKNKSSYVGNVDMNAALGKAEINGKVVNSLSVDLKTSIESHDANRTPKDYRLVEEYLVTHGLCDDSALRLLCERLKADGKITGKEKYEVTYSSEVRDALDIASKIDYKLFSSDLDFSSEHNHVQEVKKILEIDFG